MADKSSITYSYTAKMFMLVLFFSLFVTLVLVYITANKITFVASTYSNIRSIIPIMFRESHLNLRNTGRVASRRDACDACFSHSFNYVIYNDVICKVYDDSQEIDLVIFIFTTHQHEKERDAIRQTWLRYSNKNRANIRYSFLLGEVPDENLRNLVEMENKIHSDILKEDFFDTYYNLTYKTMMAFRYAITKCSHAKIVFKTDDDVWVNIPRLLKVIQHETTNLQTAVGGKCFMSAEPVRDPASKWYASFQSYPNDSYPGYCSGTGYVTSINVARKVFEISTNVPFFHLEDVYVAMCIKRLGYKLYSLQGFNSNRILFDPCLYKGDNLITSHDVPSEFLISFWNTPCTI